MANEEHLAILRQGVEGWNQWREEHEEIEPDLSGANLEAIDLEAIDLEGVNLAGANLSSANLYGANLRWADLSRANLSDSILSVADLEGANLRWADLSDADLSGADLTEADLWGTNLSAAILTDSTFTEADFSYTTVTAVDLRDVQGLDTIIHSGPSSVGLDTIELSQGQIPESFLRGCGVSDRLIEYLPSLTAQAIQYYSCFISYSSKDEALAKRLHADLQARGVRCWFAPHDLKIGARIRVGIDEAIRLHDKLLLILSKHSVGSDWVEKEVETAMEQERRQQRTVLFPIRLDTAVMKIDSGWPADVRRGRNIGDFCKWKNHDAYQEAFARLLRDLKATPDR